MKTLLQSSVQLNSIPTSSGHPAAPWNARHHSRSEFRARHWVNSRRSLGRRILAFLSFSNEIKGMKRLGKEMKLDQATPFSRAKVRASISNKEVDQ